MGEHKPSVGDKLEVGFGKLTSLFTKSGGSVPGKVLVKRKDPRDSAVEGVSDTPVSRKGAQHHSRSSSIAQEAHDGYSNQSSPSHTSSFVSLDNQVNGMRLQDTASSTSEHAAAAQGAPKNRVMSEHRVNKFHKILSEPLINIDALRELAWSGIPADLRPTCWRLLLGYLPPSKARQAQTLERKRREYQEMVPEYYDIANADRSEDELTALRQVAVDVPRTAPNVPFFHEPVTQKSLERLLYIWGIRHPASGYVQGMNDLVTPFLAVFASEHVPGPMESWTSEQLTEEIMLSVEADSYWCLCKLVEGIQDHYTYAQPGIQRSVFKIKELVRRVDESVANHLEEQNVDFIQFAWRWVNCLLIREMPFALSFRLWDTYLAEGSRFNDFLVYVSASFLLYWAEQIKQMEFQDLIMFLLKLPTQDWDESKMEMILSKAFIWRTSFDDAQSHLKA